MCSAKSLTSRRAGLPNYCRGIGSNRICERPPDRLICNRRGTRRGLTIILLRTKNLEGQEAFRRISLERPIRLQSHVQAGNRLRSHRITGLALARWTASMAKPDEYRKYAADAVRLASGGSTSAETTPLLVLAERWQRRLSGLRGHPPVGVRRI